MQRSKRALVAVTLLALSLLGHVAHAASLTRERVRADLIAAELSGKFPPNKANKPDHAMYYTARKAAQKVEKDLSGSSASGIMTAAPADPAPQASPHSSER